MQRLNTQFLQDGTIIDRYINPEDNEIILFIRPICPIETVTVKIAVSRLGIVEPEETDV